MVENPECMLSSWSRLNKIYSLAFFRYQVEYLKQVNFADISVFRDFTCVCSTQIDKEDQMWTNMEMK